MHRSRLQLRAVHTIHIFKPFVLGLSHFDVPPLGAVILSGFVFTVPVSFTVDIEQIATLEVDLCEVYVGKAGQVLVEIDEIMLVGRHIAGRGDGVAIGEELGDIDASTAAVAGHGCEVVPDEVMDGVMRRLVGRSGCIGEVSGSKAWGGLGSWAGGCRRLTREKTEGDKESGVGHQPVMTLIPTGAGARAEVKLKSHCS